MSIHLRRYCGLFVLSLLLTSAPGVAQSAQREATPVVPEESDEMVIDEPRPVAPPLLESAAEFCLMQNGVVVQRFPILANNTSEPIRLSGSNWFCELTGSPEAEPPTSRISVSLETLYAAEPTLAALAYLAAVPVPELDESFGLATAYCNYLGGSSRFGTNKNLQGGWASDPDNPGTTSIGICVFPDGSAIDDWGLTYNAEGVIRGADLTGLLRYQGFDDTDAVFPAD